MDRRDFEIIAFILKKLKNQAVVDHFVTELTKAYSSFNEKKFREACK
jgi:hypothetical protein